MCQHVSTVTQIKYTYNTTDTTDNNTNSEVIPVASNKRSKLKSYRPQPHQKA